MVQWALFSSYSTNSSRIWADSRWGAPHRLSLIFDESEWNNCFIIYTRSEFRDGSSMIHSELWLCVPPAHQLASLLQSLAWLLYLNCNCCSQFAYHHVITQILYLILPLIIFCFIMKNSTPPAPPLARARDGVHPPPHPPLPVNPSLLNSQTLLFRYFQYFSILFMFLSSLFRPIIFSKIYF
jgi:hypothetical protein